jgi:methanogenic corrinoid protein MtbC1
MASKERTQELMKGLYDAVVAMDEEAAVEYGKAVLDEGIDAYYAVMNGLAKGMDKVGQLYDSQEYFVPELLLCSDALYAGLEILKPHIKADDVQAKGQVVIGVVEGDIHDIGKNLVKIMFEAAGWTVYDLGKDVQLARFAEEQQRTNSDIVALSALMTTSMLALPEAIKMIKARDPNVAVMVGGAPVTRDIAKSYGADGYADNAGQVVQEAIRVISEVKKAGK